MKYLSIIGSTGSNRYTDTRCGVSTSRSIQGGCLSAHHNIDLLEKQIKEYQPFSSWSS